MKGRDTVGPYVQFGKWLRACRIAARLKSQPQAELRAQQRHLPLINQGKLSHLERGLNGDPDPAFLRQLAQLYGLEYREIVSRWIRVKFSVEGELTEVGARVDKKRHIQAPPISEDQQARTKRSGAALAVSESRLSGRRRNAAIDRAALEDQGVEPELVDAAIRILNALARRGVAAAPGRSAAAQRAAAARARTGRP